jgi:hypothetical protein
VFNLKKQKVIITDKCTFIEEQETDERVRIEEDDDVSFEEEEERNLATLPPEPVERAVPIDEYLGEALPETVAPIRPPNLLQPVVVQNPNIQQVQVRIPFHEQHLDVVPALLDRPRREVHQPEYYGRYYTYLTTAEPESYKQMLNREDKKNWEVAMESEFKSHREMHTWDIVSKTDAPIVSSRWVYKLKTNPDNTTTYKARLVARGFTQTEGIDYDETFAPVVGLSWVMVILML